MNPFAELLTVSSACSNAKLYKRETTIGRKPECDIQVDNAFVSGQHIRIVQVALDEEVLLQDVSTNGCYVNGIRVGKNKFVGLKNGDQISLTPPPCEAIARNQTDHIAFIYRSLRADRSSCIIVETDEARVAQTYNVVKELGAGSFGKVYLAVNKAEQQSCALKCIDKRRFALLCSGGTSDTDETNGVKEDVSEAADIFEEVMVLNKLSHPHIIRVLDVLETPRFVVIALDLATGGDLEQLLMNRGRLKEKDSRSLIVQIFNALSYLHSCKVVHRDLKPANVLIHAPVDGSKMPRLLLTDFGLSKILDSRGARCTTICGTPLYIAPEVVVSASKAKEHQNAMGYDHRVDVWSAGMILYEMVCGHLPVAQGHAKSLGEQIIGIAQGMGVTIRPPDGVVLSEPLIEFLQRLLTHEQNRISADDALNDPWFTRVNASYSGTKRKNSELARQETVLSTPSSVEAQTPHSASSARSFGSPLESGPLATKKFRSHG